MPGQVSNGFKIPVSFEALQSSITDLQKILDGLQPNTKQWKELSRIINTMTSEASKLQAQMSMPFTSQKQFNSAEKTIDKLEQTAARVSIVMNSLKFSDIKLTPEQTNEFKKFEKEIKAIQDAYKQLQETVKQQLISSGNNAKLLTGIDKNALTKDFEEIQSLVENQVQELESKVQKQQDIFNGLKSNIELGNRATALTSTGKGLTREALGDSIFDKYLQELSGGGVKLKLGKGISKQALLTEIEEMFHLEPGQLQHLASKTIGDINKAFQDYGAKGNTNIFKGFIDRQKRAAKDLPLVSENKANLEQQLKEYRALQDELQRLQTSSNMGQASADAAAKIEQVQGRIQALQTSIANGVSANSDYGNSLKQLGSQCGQMRSQLESVNAAFLRQQSVMNSFNSMKMMITNFMGFTQILNLTKRAIKEAANHIKELDTVMNQISIVTDMDTGDLWEQVESYSAMAQKYGASIKGAYEVSKIYYQQGLDTKDVLTLTNETLKLSKISGMDYAATTDYMTTAIRGFKMEMQDASVVVDVYSNLASNTAVSQEELAVAMSKTASSMESVGSTFEETSAMIATMVAVTRESATNIGSAMKSIASRYGELTKNPASLLDSEGEAMSFNKVDTALQSVGISMKTVNGQFREFTDVILELGEKWDQLESTQQRYIATQFAGNRQQSRFLALVSNVDLLKENIENAENSEGIGDLQALKALDSIENRIEQVRVAYQQFYTTVGVQDVWKFFLNGIKNTINSLNSLPKLFNKVPVGAIAAISLVISGIKTLAIHGLTEIAKTIQPILSSANPTIQSSGKQTGELWIRSVYEGIKAIKGQTAAVGTEVGQGLQSGVLGSVTQSTYNLKDIQKWKAQITPEMNLGQRAALSGQLLNKGYFDMAGAIRFTNMTNEEALKTLEGFEAQCTLTQQRMLTLGGSVQMVGSAFSLLALTLNDGSKAGKTWAAVGTTIAGAISLIGVAISTSVKIAALEIKSADAILKSIPWYAAISALVTFITGIVSVIRLITHSLDDDIDDATKRADELATKAKEAQSNLKQFEQAKNKVEELEKARHDSAEAAQEYQTAVDNLADSYPSLIKNYNAAGEVVINLQRMEDTLTEARRQSAEATYAAAEAEIKANNLKAEKAKKELPTVNDALGNFISDSKGKGKIFAYKNKTNEQVGASAFSWEKEAVPIQGYASRILKAAEQKSPEQVLAIYDELVNYLDETGLYISKEFQDVLMPVVNKAREANLYYEENDVSSKKMINSFLNGATGKSTANVLSRSSGLFDAVSETLFNQMSADSVEFNNETLAKYYEELFGNLDDIYNNLSDTPLKQLDTILSNSTAYTSTDIVSQLSDYGIQVEDWLIELIQQKLADNKEALQNKVTQVKSQGVDTSEIDAIINDENTEITLTERQLLNKVLDQAVSLENNGQDSSSFLTDFMNTYQQIVALPAKLRNQVIDQFITNGITKEGLTRTLQYIEGNDEISTAISKVTHTDSWGNLETLIKNSRSNLLLTVNTVTDAFKNDWEDIDKFISKLTSGFDQSSLDDILTEAQKYGIDPKQLEKMLGLENGKYKLGTENIDNVYSQVTTFYSKSMDGIKSDVEEAFGRIENIKFDETKIIPKERVEDYQTVLGGRFTEFFEQDQEKNWQLRAEKAEEDLYTALGEEATKVTSGVDNFTKMLEQWAATQTQLSHWKAGDYSSFVDTGLFERVEEAYNRIRQVSRGAQKASKEKDNKDFNDAVTTYASGWSKLSSDLAAFGLDYVNKHLSEYEGINWAQETDVSQVDGTITESEISLAQIAAQNAGKTVKEINAAVGAAITKKHAPATQPKALANLLSGGFTADEFTAYMADYAPDKNILQFFDKQSGEFEGVFKDLFEWDEETGNIKIAAGKSIKEVSDAFKEATDAGLQEGSRLYASLIDEVTKDAIADADFADVHKRNAAVLSELSKATIGSRIAVTGLSEDMKTKLQEAGFEFTGDYVEITSQNALNSLMNALTTLRSDSSLDPQESKVLEGLEKYLKPTTLSNVISETVSKEAAEAWAIATSAESAEKAMKDLGYTWSDAANAYVQDLDASTDTIASIQEQIDALDFGNDPQAQQKKNELQTKLNKLKSSKGSQQYSALSNIISNYQTVSDDAIQALADSLNLPLEKVKQYFSVNGNGTYTADISSIITDINNGILDVENGVLALLGNTIGSMLSSVLSSLEDSIDGNVSGSYSEMAGKALAIYTKMSKEEQDALGNDFTNLIEFDITTGQSKLTDTAIAAEQQQIFDQMYSDQNTILEAKQAYADWLKQQRDAGIKYANADIALSEFIKTNEDYSFLSQYRTDVSTWNTHINKGDDRVVDYLIGEEQKAISDAMNKHVASMAKESLAAFDFNGIFDESANKDKNKDTLKTLLTNLGIDPTTLTEDAMETIYGDLLKGNFTKLDEILPEGTKTTDILSSAKRNEFVKAHDAALETALDELLTKDVGTYSETTQAVLKALELDGKTTQEKITSVQSILDSSKFTTQAERNSREQEIAQATGKKRAENLLNLLSGGFTDDEFNKWVEENFLPEERASQSIKTDYLTKANGKYTVKTGVTVESILSDFGISVDDLNYTPEYLRKIEADWSTAVASEANELNAEVRAVKQINDILSGSLGEQISVADLDIGDIDITDVVKTGNEVTINSEAGRKALIEWIASKRDSYEGQQQVLNAINAAEQEMRSKYDHAAAYEQLSSGLIDRDVADTIKLTLATADEMSMSTNEFMEQFGYKWSDKYHKFYVETADQLSAVTDRINNDEALNESSQITALASIEGLKQDNDKVYQQYTTLSEAIGKSLTGSDELYQKLVKLGIKDEYFEDDGDLGKKLNIGKLLRDRKKLGISDIVFKALGDNFASFYDDITGTLSKATEYALNGTQSESDKQAFIEQAASLGMEITESDFVYNDLVQGWVLNINKLAEFRDIALSQMVGKDSETINTYGKLLVTDAAKEKVDIKSFLGSDNRNVGSFAYRTLEKQLTDYYTLSDQFKEATINDRMPPDVQEQIRQWNANRTNLIKDATISDIEALNKGGAEAIAVIEKLTADGAKMSPEEIASYFKPQADRYEGYLDTISQLSMGSYVAAGDLRNILQAAGVVDANGIVTNTDKMVDAYKAIYDKLSGQSADIYSTLAQRNKAYVTYLKADHQKNGDILSTLQNGGVMDLDQLESLANKYITDKDLGQIDPAKYGYSINKWGQVVIDNWQTFSQKVFGEILDTTDADYIAAYKAFNEGKIQRDNQIKDMITSEAEAIKGAKVGDKIDISGIISKYGDSIFDGFNVSIVDGILEIHDAMQLPQIATQVLSAAVKAGDVLESELLDFIASIQDGIIDGIKSATDLNVNGTDSFADMQSFITEFNNTVSGSVIDASAFYYDTFSKTFKLDSGTLKKYVEAKTKELASYGLSDSAIQQYINDQTKGLQRSSIDVAALLEAEGKDERNKIATSLAEQIKGLDNYHDIAQKAATLLGKTDEEIRDANVEHILQVLMNGGIAAVEIIKDIKGDEVTSADISAAYSANIERMRTTLNELSLQAGNVVSEYTAVILNSVGITTTDLGNGTAVINQQDTDIGVDDLVNAYITLYGTLKSSNESTIEDLNNAFAKMLETSESKETAALEALQNAAAMTWTQLGELLSKQGKQLSDIYGDLESYGIEQIGAGKVRIFDFFAFAQEMGYEYGSREFTSALKTYNQGLISYDKEVSSNIRDEINSLLSAKPGDQVDLTYLWDAYGEDTINEILAQYGASIHNGLLTLEDNADITGIITSLGQLAAAAGDMIPSELAELEDAIAELLSKITDLISKGFKGELNNADKQTVTEWAELNNLDISWQKTANGWKIAESSIWDCYNAVNDLNIAEGEVLRTQIKQSKIEHDDRYASSQATIKHIDDLQDELKVEQEIAAFRTKQQIVRPLVEKGAKLDFFEGLNGNVDMYTRPWIDNADGTHSSVSTAHFNLNDFSKEIGVQEIPFQALFTPIPVNATKESDVWSNEQLDEYISQVLKDAQAAADKAGQKINIDFIKAADTEGMLIDIKQFGSDVEKEFNDMDIEAQQLHEWSEAWETMRRNKDEYPDNSARIAALKEELALAREINAERATSKDDSFDFMNNKIPAGQENPLTYAKNLTKAFKAINDAYKVKNTYDLNGGGVKRTRTGYMGYEDFYNIVNELNNMAAVSGHAIQIGHTIEGNAYELDGTLESASNFITEGIKTLTSVDSGEMMVNIGALGINLANGGKELQNGIKDGVDAVADAEIAAIDAMIAVLEVIVAMEKLKEIDADQDMTIDLGEMFKFEVPDDPTSKIIDFTDKYDEIRKWLLDQMQKNKDLQKAMNEFKFGINGKTMSMAEWLNLSFKELGLDQDGFRAYNKAISAFYTAAMSNDYDLDKVAESVKQVLIDSGVTDLEVDIGDYSLIIKGGNISVVDWRTGGAQDAIKAFLDHNGLKDTEENRKEAQSKIQTAISNYTEGKHLDEISLEYVLRVNNRLVVDDDGNVTGVIYDGHTYSKSDTDKFKRAIAMNYIKDRGILDPNRKDITDVQLEGNVATYNYKVGKKNVEFKITYDDQGGIESANYNVDGTEYSSIQEAQDKGYESMLQKMVNDGKAVNLDDAKTKLSKDVYLYQEWNIRTKTELKFEKDGKTIDINNFTGAEARKELASLTPDMLADIAKINGETGNIDVTLPSTGVTFTVPGKGIAIEADGEDTSAIDTSALLSYIQQNLLGQDLGLQENITAAITTAFQNLSNIDPSNLSEAASAMGNLATQAGALANVDWDKIIKGMNGINPPEGNLPNAPGDNPTKGSSNPAPTKDSMPTLDEIIKSGRILGSAGASDVGGFGRGKAPTIPLESVTGTAQTLTIQPAKAVVDEDVAKHMEDIPTVEVPVNEITLNVESFENLKTIGTEAGNAVAEGFNESVEQMPNQLQNVLGSVREHFNTLVEDVKTAIGTIKDELHSIQQHASITWTITANDGSGNENSLINQLFNGNLGSASNSGGAESAGLEVPEIPINIAIKIEEVQDSIEKLQELLEELANTPYEIQIKANIEEVITKLEQIKTELTDLTQSTHDVEIKLVDIEMVLMHLENVVTLLENIGSSITEVKINDESITKASGELDTLKGKMTPESATYTITVNADPIPAPPSDASATYTITVKTIGGGGGGLPTVNKPGATGSKNLPGTRTLSTCATGNFGLAKSKGTLMGELGPELVVSNGRYFVAGQDGAEMVNLDKDAIVFNHLQTEQLLKNGMSAGRGRAVTNERNAVAFATGNINGGPAMASAAQALATLKQLRAMWQALKGASISDLAGAGGGGGGGGGGGNEDKAVDPKEWVALVERWYNLMQKIAVLEHQITHEEQLRSTIQSAWNKNGTAYAKSQVKSLNALREQMQLQEQLNISRADYYDKRREALKSSALGQIIEFDENGQMLFKKDLDPSKFDGFTDAMEWRTWLTGYDEDHKARFSSKEKYEKLRAAGLIPDHVYDSNGKEITMDSDQDGEVTDQEREDYYYNVSKQVFDNMDEYQEAQQSLYDSIQEGQVTFLELQEQYNELLNEMYENQMDLEEKVLDAIENLKQREIDELQDTRDALEESVDKYINGLSDALDKERDMYDNQEAQDNLNRKRRQLGILERSGGSATDIKALQDEIQSLERDQYFDLQQQQIDAIREASDLQIERMDQQIDIMTQSLEYQKAYGLLWGEVYTVMGEDATTIAQFIAGHNPEFWESSPLHSDEMMNEYLFGAQQWTEFRKNTDEYGKALIGLYNYTINQAWEDFDKSAKNTYGATYNEERKKKAREIYEAEFKESNDSTAAAEKARLYLTGEQIIDKRKEEITGYGRTYEVGDKSDHWEYSQIQGDDKNHRAHHYKDGVYTGETKKEAHTWSGETCSKCGYAKPKPQASSGGGGGGGGGSSCAYCGDKCVTSCTQHCASSCWSSGAGSTVSGKGCSDCTGTCHTGCKGGCKITATSPVKAASGGFVSHGTYELGERGIETVLTAEQTKVLRNNILSNRPSSLISLLKTYNEGFSNMSNPFNTSPTTEDNSTNIDKIELTMNVQQMSNDYDARRAGQEMMNEVMRIARKTNAANSIRR